MPRHEGPQKQVHGGIQIHARFVREPRNRDDGRVWPAGRVRVHRIHPCLQRDKRRVVDVLARLLGATRDRERIHQAGDQQHARDAAHLAGSAPT